MRSAIFALALAAAVSAQDDNSLGLPSLNIPSLTLDTGALSSLAADLSSELASFTLPSFSLPSLSLPSGCPTGSKLSTYLDCAGSAAASAVGAALTNSASLCAVQSQAYDCFTSWCPSQSTYGSDFQSTCSGGAAQSTGSVITTTDASGNAVTTSSGSTPTSSNAAFAPRDVRGGAAMGGLAAIVGGLAVLL